MAYGRRMAAATPDPEATAPIARLRHRVRTTARWALRFAACALAVAAVTTPLALERSLEGASFEDRLGTLPVEVRLAHNGYSTLDTGLLGSVFWQRTAAGGFGARLRSTGPPMADGTLASYVSPAFVRANTRFLDDPGTLAAAYGAELRDQVVVGTLGIVVPAGLLGGGLACWCWYLAGAQPRRRRLIVAGGLVVAGTVASATLATLEFRSWDGTTPVEATYPLPDHPEFSFSSPQAREIAVQIQPFVEKNTARIRQRAADYESTAEASLGEVLPQRVAALTPREGEVAVIAEADPQGSLVGTRVRGNLYASLGELLPDDALVLRTVAGDISSNGTVAESGFVEGEATAGPGIPLVAAKGDHDTDTTVEQLLDDGATVPDTEIVEEGGLSVASARDPAFKALFGGLVVDDPTTSEEDAGAALRTVVDDAGAVPVYVVLHQPRAVEGYLGLELSALGEPPTGRALTTPVDDGVPDVPAGVVTIGHLHDADGPWVLWNTDGEEITWTVVTQLGTSGGVEENPTVDRFSTPFSAPLKPLSVQVQYLNPETGLQTGLVPITIATDGTVTVGDRIDVGLPGGEPAPPSPLLRNSRSAVVLLTSDIHTKELR